MNVLSSHIFYLFVNHQINHYIILIVNKFHYINKKKEAVSYNSASGSTTVHSSLLQSVLARVRVSTLNTTT